MSKLQKKPTAHKRGHPTLQNVNFKKNIYFCGSFLPSWIRIRIPNTDPDPLARLNTDPIRIRLRIQSGYGSGSETLVSGSVNFSIGACSVYFYVYWIKSPCFEIRTGTGSSFILGLFSYIISEKKLFNNDQCHFHHFLKSVHRPFLVLFKLVQYLLMFTFEDPGPGFRIRIRIRIRIRMDPHYCNLSCWIRIRIRIQIADPDPDPGGQKLPTKIEKVQNFDVFKYWMFSFEGWRLLL